MQVFKLGEFVDDVEEVADAGLLLHAGGLLPPSIVENLRKLRRLDLLHDDVVLALIGQAYIDPLGIYGAMKDRGVWAFQPTDFTMVQILAKKGGRPVALMRLDLLSDNLDFVTLRQGQLVLREHVTGEALVEKMREPGMTEERFHAWLVGKMKAAIDEGMANAA
jgi:hypothetical protein